MRAPPLIIAHRGSSARAPENTMAAFQMALDAGADGLEFDVQLAKDGVPVVIHDTSLLRTARRNERVASLTADQLANVDVGSWFNRTFPRLANPEFASASIPGLAQTLQLAEGSNRLLYVELKCTARTYHALAAAVCDTIRRSPHLSHIIVKSFHLPAIVEVRRLLPEVQTAALFAPKVLDLVRRRQYIIDLANAADAQQISIHRALATRSLTRLAADNNLPVTVWTVDDPRWLLRSERQEIRALITNDPSKMIAAARLLSG